MSLVGHIIKEKNGILFIPISSDNVSVKLGIIYKKDYLNFEGYTFFRIFKTGKKLYQLQVAETKHFPENEHKLIWDNVCQRELDWFKIEGKLYKKYEV